MARTSKKVKETKQSVKGQGCVWQAGIYARLSVDNHNWKNESIDTQIEIAKEYIEQSEDIVLVRCYSDLGRTGTNFEREGFDILMSDIRRHIINCIIVKDFSRFGRNYIETGNYLEKIFPFFHIRFVSVSDNYDSHRTGWKSDELTMNLKNIVNELYARDCAEKVRVAKKFQIEQGCYVGGIPPYGYSIGQMGEKRVLIPEERTKEIVRTIYGLFDEENRVGKVISYLYRHCIHRPSEYRKFGHVYCEGGEILRQWSEQTVRAILTNCVYIGALAQKRTGKEPYRSGVGYRIEEGKKVIIEHTHKPIIEEKLFYRVSSKIEEKRTSGKSKNMLQEDVYKNLIYCGECGSKLKRICTSNIIDGKVRARIYSYGCPNICRIDELKCDSHFVSFNAMNRIVLELLRKEFYLSGVCIKTLIDINHFQEKQKEKKLERKIKEIEADIQKVNIEMSSVYMKYKLNEINREGFLNLKAVKEAEKVNLIKELARQEAEKQRIRKETEEMSRFIYCLTNREERVKMDGQVTAFLVKRVTLYKNGHIEIIFNFRNEWINEGRKLLQPGDMGRGDVGYEK